MQRCFCMVNDKLVKQYSSYVVSFSFHVFAGCYHFQFPRRLFLSPSYLTHWDRVTHVGFSRIIIIGSDNGLAPHRRQAIIWTNAGILLIGPSGSYFSKIVLEAQAFSFKKMHLKMPAKGRPFCLGLDEMMAVSVLQGWWYNLMVTLYRIALVQNSRGNDFYHSPNIGDWYR